MGLEKRIVKFAVASRIVLLLLQIVFNWCIPDHNAEVFQAAHFKEETFWDTIISFLIEGFSRWDAQYFIHVALNGYTYENTVAFFPLFPIALCKPIAILLHFLTFPLISAYYCVLLAGVCINFGFFIVSALVLFRLSFIIFGSKEMSFVAALLFAINPASIFFSSCYSETVFSLLTFLGLFAFEVQRLKTAAFIFNFSAVTRSNGILAFFFVAHAKLKQFCSQLGLIPPRSFPFYLLVFISQIVSYASLCLMLFVWYQNSIFTLFCDNYYNISFSRSVLEQAERNGYKLASNSSSPWCNWTLPLSYTYVQEHYWNVGFMKYFLVKQLPNFLLATPILSILIISSLKYFITNWQLTFSLGLIKPTGIQQKESKLYRNSRCFLYFAHVFFLSLFCTFFIHVQLPDNSNI